MHVKYTIRVYCHCSENLDIYTVWLMRMIRSRIPEVKITDVTTVPSTQYCGTNTILWYQHNTVVPTQYCGTNTILCHQLNTVPPTQYCASNPILCHHNNTMPRTQYCATNTILWNQHNTILCHYHNTVSPTQYCAVVPQWKNEIMIRFINSKTFTCCQQKFMK